MGDTKIRDEIAELARSMFDRGLTHASTGNISVRVDDGWLVTPTGSTLGNLDPARISKLDPDGNHVSGDDPTMETFLHLAMYEMRQEAGAVVHLHATHSVAVSCLDGIDPNNVLPPITAYFVMKIGTLPMVPFFPPGSLDLAKAVKEMASDHHAVLLANHGPVVAGKNLRDAVYASEELEETAKLFLLLKDMKTRFLTDQQITEIRDLFPN